MESENLFACFARAIFFHAKGAKEFHAKDAEEFHEKGAKEFHAEGAKEFHAEGVEEFHAEGAKGCGPFYLCLFIPRIKFYNPFNPEFISKHSKISAPGAILYRHFYLPPC